MFNVSNEFLTAVRQNTRTVTSSVGIGNKSLTNLVANGDFSNGVTSWTSILATGVSATNNEATFTPTATAGRLYGGLTTTTIGDVLYRRAKIKSTSNLVGIGNTTSSYVKHSGSGNYETISCQVIASSTSHYISIVDTRTSGWDVIYVKEVTFLNLTSLYGKGNEPSKQFMDDLMSRVGWFGGTKTVPSRFVDDRILTNVLLNSDFSNGTTSWSANNSTNTVTSAILTNTGDGTSVQPRISQSMSTVLYSSGKKIYNWVVVRVRNASCTSLMFTNYSTGMTTQTSTVVTNPVQDQWYTVSGIITLPTTGITTNVVGFQVRHNYIDNATALGKTMEVNYVMSLDLTALYGSGNEPSKSYLDGIITSWFNTKYMTLAESGESTIIGDFSIESSFGNNDLPTIGATVSNKLALRLINDNRIPQVIINTPIRPYVAIDIGSGVYEWVKMGEFYTTSSDVEVTKLEVSLDAFDDLAGYDQYEYSTSLVLPLTVSQVMSDLTTRYGVTFTPNQNILDLPLTSIPTGTVRQVIGQLAGYMCTNATMDSNGDVNFRFFSAIQEVTFNMDTTNYSSFKLNSNSQIKISKLQVKVGDNLLSSGDGTGYTLLVDNAQLNTQSTLDTIYAVGFPFSYYAYNMVAQGMPHLQIGDMLYFTYVKLDGTTSKILIPIINHKFTFNGGMRSEFKASVPKENTTTISVSGGSTLGQTVDRTTVDLLNAMDTSMKIVTGNQGGYIITILDVNGKPQEFVVSSSPDINDTSANVWVWNSGGLVFNTGGYKSTDPTNYKIALTSDGQINASAMTTGSMSAQRITTGKLQDKTNSTWIDLDTGKFSFGGGKLAWDGSALTILYNGTTLDSAIGGKADSNDLTPYIDNIVIDANGLTIGKAGNPFKVNIDNQSVEFLDFGTGGGSYTPDPNAVAYITGKKMFITDLETTNSVKVGNHQIVKYDANITLIKYVG